MKRLSIWIACLGLVLMTSAMVQNAQARTSVSVGLNFGDRYDGPEPYWRDEPRVVIVPGTRVYYVSDTDYDIYRYGRFWYMNANGGWYRSRSYRGPWIYVGYRAVPQQIGYVPQGYRRHWRDFRDDNARYGSYRGRQYDRRYYDRNQDWRARDRNRDGRIDSRDQNDRRVNDRNGDGQIDSRDQNRDPRDTNGDGRVDERDRNRDPRDTNGDGQVDWRDR